MENVNALTDIPLLITVNGRLSVREALLNAHIPESKYEMGTSPAPVILDKNVPGYVYGAELRLLTAVTAIVLRYYSACDKDVLQIPTSEILTHGLSPENIDKALLKLIPGSFLFDDTQPFMQQPAKPNTPKSPGKLKKLLPSMLSDKGEEFWNMLTQQDTLSLADAALYLLVYHYYSPAGNSKYAGQKAKMGSPGFHFVGTKMTATELIWKGKSLLHTLLAMIPRNWVEGDGLPAWADRDGSRSRSEHPLWRATWSSNSAVCYWKNDRLIGVEIGGIPLKWLPKEAGIRAETESATESATESTTNSKKSKKKDFLKEYWDMRNQSDPFYLYLANKSGKLQAQRMDINRNATDLAVEWAANGKIAEAAKAYDRILSPSDCRLLFIQHYIDGTSSSPVIRYSHVLVADPQLWSFGLSERAQNQVKQHANFIQKLHYCVTQPFHRAQNTNSNLGNTLPTVLDSLTEYRSSVSDIFWRAMTTSYEEFLAQASVEEKRPTEIIAARDTAAQIALQAFNEAIAPYRNQDPALFAAVYSNVNHHINFIKKEFAISTSERRSNSE